MKHNLIIAGPERQRNLSWQQRLNGFSSTCILSDKLETLWDSVMQIRPDMLLLDLDLLKLDHSNAENYLSRLCTETKVIVLNGDISEDLEWDLYMAGVRGCCRIDIQPNILKQAAKAVQQGELWVRRSLTCRLSEQLVNLSITNLDNRTSGLLNNLTQREYDIAICVGNGESNKKIAQTHAITERTVKAHLSGVYQKLGITDRLNLALIVSANDPYLYRGGLQLQ